MIVQMQTQLPGSVPVAFTYMPQDLLIEPTMRTPYVKYEEETDKVIIRGNSIEVDMHRFYNPVMSKIRRHLTVHNYLEVSFYFNNLNTSSVKVLFDLFKFFRLKMMGDAKIKIKWYGDRANEDILETGKDFAELFELDLRVIPV